jgi:hypothetical protein
MKGETVTSWFKFYGILILILFITIGWGIFFYYVSPEVVVQKIGIQNSYLVAFIISAICGFSSITSTTFYVTIGALAKGGANPLLLGIAGGLGVCLSDFAFFYVVSKGTPVVDKHWKKLMDLMKRLVTWMPDWMLHVFVFAYSGFFPAPNDLLLVALAFGGTPFKKVMPYLFAGDIVSTLLIAYLLK